MRIQRKSEGGQVLIMVTLGLLVLFGILGLVIDLGWANFRQQAARSAAEAAALAAVEAAQAAGGNTPACGGTNIAPCSTAPVACTTAAGTPTNIQIGCYYAKVNGFTVGGNNGKQNVTMASGVSPTLPPSVGGDPADFKVIKGFAPGALPSYWVTARVTEVVPQLFLPILGNKSMTSSARATAGIVYTVPNGCIFVLDKTGGQDTLLVSGSGVLSVPNCGIFVNNGCLSNCKAFDVTGSGQVKASFIDVYKAAGETGCPVTGPCNVNYSPNNCPGAKCAVSIPPTNVAGEVADPLAGVAAPVAGTDYQACTAANEASCCANWDSKNNKLINQYPSNGTSSQTLVPGVYCGGINFQGGSNTLTFTEGGNYILLGSSGGNALNLSGGGTVNMTGTGGLMFYSTVDPSFNQFGNMNIQGGENVTLTAPSSGTYKDILYFEDRSQPGTTDKIAGGSNMALTGIFYSVNSTLDLSAATAQSNNNLAVVVNKLICEGACTLGSPDILSGTGPPTVAVVALIE